MGAHASLAREIAAPAEEVFAALTDLDGLPEWNDVVQKLVERPTALEPGAQWVVACRATGMGWRSRSHLEELDRARRRFVHRSGTDDGNPSYARWTWEVDDLGQGRSRVRVRFDLHPATFWRRLLLARMRGRMLARREVPASLAALARRLE